MNMNDLTIAKVESKSTIKVVEEKIDFEEALESNGNELFDDRNFLIKNKTESIIEENDLSKYDYKPQSIELIHH
ncbi:6651_t:CDS:2 [Scutellospora calospora]|uniref:6651_t:CDS:1 n=1 Tax=Scutellospora calospora TaxID=85575 RepID=A0ACA9K6T4_9GLOM|nr:6651_t:CDS:2 [Scutellospora calospora]